jgi:adenylylsulfate kinase-like enzyme
LAPNEGIEIKATGSVHLSLQGKGGVGKSLVASILALYLNRKALAVRCIDSDPVNKTLSQYKGVRSAPAATPSRRRHRSAGLRWPHPCVPRRVRAPQWRTALWTLR